MDKWELAKKIADEAERLGYGSMMINPDMISELNQASYQIQRNMYGLKVYAVWYTDKVFIAAIWSDQDKIKLTVLENVLM